MKVAYIAFLPQLDTDLSYIQEAQKISDFTCYIYVNQKHINKSIIRLSRLYPRTGVFDCSIYPEFEKFRNIIDLSRVKIINIAQSRMWQLKAFCLTTKLALKLNKEYDIVHITTLVQPDFLPLYICHKKMVVSMHDPIPHSGSKNWKDEYSRKIVLKLTNNFILFNKNQQDEFINTYKLQNKNILTTRFSIFPWMKCLDIDDVEVKEDYILFFGRISKYKGVQFLLPAMKRIHEVYPNVKLIVAGGGKYTFDIDEYKNLSYIDFRNRFIPDSEISALIKNALFIVCPYTDATQSAVVMTVFTYGKPVLATNVGGLPEMVINQRHGLIIEPSKIEAIVEGVLNLLSNKDKLAYFSSNIEEDYGKGVLSWIKIAEEINVFYKEITQKNH